MAAAVLSRERLGLPLLLGLAADTDPAVIQPVVSGGGSGTVDCKIVGRGHLGWGRTLFATVETLTMGRGQTHISN